VDTGQTIGRLDTAASGTWDILAVIGAGVELYMMKGLKSEDGRTT
jgi:hypothetical protein